jgi:D-alanyl-D-alanine carboxypeptidase
MCRHSAASRLIFCTCLALLITALAVPADARGRSHSHARGSYSHHHHFKPQPPRDAAVVIDGTTGKVVFSRNATAMRYPASLTKMMTLYLLFEQLKQGKLSLDSMITASEHASDQRPTKLGLTPGESISVEVAIKAIVVRSANDVAVAIGEAIGGSEEEFARLMTRKAHSLGMDDTTFRNASGLPNPGQKTTARDLAILGRHVAYDFPQYYHYFATPSFTFQGRLYQTHDNLLYRFDGVDGIKTGYTNASGFNLVSSLVREGKHIIGVVMGGRTARGRDNEMMELLASTLERSQQHPNMLAQANVPWQSPTMSKNRTMLAASEFDQTKSLNLKTNGFDEDETPLPATDDEDAAEAMTARDNAGGVPVAANTPAHNTIASNNAPIPLPSQAYGTAINAAPVSSAPLYTPASRNMDFTPPVPASKPTLPRTQMAAIEPTPKPRLEKQLEKQQMVLASLMPIPQSHSVALTPPPSRKPAPIVEEGDIGGASVPVQVARHPADADNVKRWAVQIGAFGDEVAAKTQLALYAERSMDILGRAKRTVLPFDSVDGQKMFRARFGPFAENEAREVCRRMTERGQTCFAAVVSN